MAAGRSRSAADTAAKKKSGAASGAHKKQTESRRARSQRGREVKAIVLFALSLLLLFLVLIKGQNVWEWAHNFLFGLFGLCTFIVPLFMMAVAVLEAVDRFRGRMGAKLVETGLLVLCLSSLIDVLSVDALSLNYVEHLTAVYNEGKQIMGGGFVGGILGYPLEYGLSTAGATVVLFLLAFILIMLVADLNLNTLFSFFKRLFTRRRYEDYDDEEELDTEEEYEEHTKPQKSEKNKPFKFDIPVDDIPEQRTVVEKAPTEKSKKVVAAYYSDDETPPAVEFEEIVSKHHSEKMAAEDEEVFNNEVESRQDQTDDTKAKRPKKRMPEVSSDLGFLPEDDYVKPPISLLKKNSRAGVKDIAEMENTANRLVEVLRSFGVETRVLNVSQGPTVTRYELQPSAGVKISKITNLSDDIALNLATAGVRIEAPIPNKAAVGIEVPNKQTALVGVRDIIESDAFQNAKSKLTIALGKDIGGNVVLGDIAKMPHGLIAGSTGSGKSVCINSIIISLLYKASPEDVKFLIIDPKMVELGMYNGIPHLLVPVVTDPRKAAGALAWAINEMERRYKIFADHNVRDLSAFNHLAERDDELEKIPQMVIIIDELADLMMTAPNEVEDSICRIAQKARAAGMHLIIATQRPSVDVVTGLIKANIPTRIAFAVSSQIDSRTILDMAGAEKLLGRGDMLFSPVGSSKPTRVQGCFVSDSEIEQVIEFVKGKHTMDYDEEVMQEIEKQAVKEKGAKTKSDDDDGDEDPMLQAAIDCVVDAGQASTSLLQRRLKLGYARAARIVDEMEARGIVGPFEGAKPRQVLITKAELLEKRAGEE